MMHYRNSRLVSKSPAMCYAYRGNPSANRNGRHDKRGQGSHESRQEYVENHSVFVIVCSPCAPRSPLFLKFQTYLAHVEAPAGRALAAGHQLVVENLLELTVPGIPLSA